MSWSWEPLSADRVGVLVARNEQRALVERALGRELGDIEAPVVGTANKIQGLEYDLTVVWYPLAGAAEFDGFHGDPARLAVMATRHRHGCIVVGRQSDRAMFEDLLSAAWLRVVANSVPRRPPAAGLLSPAPSIALQPLAFGSAGHGRPLGTRARATRLVPPCRAARRSGGAGVVAAPVGLGILAWW